MSEITIFGHNNIVNNAGGDINQTAFTKEAKINSEEELLIAAKNALISIEILHVREKYYDADWSNRGDVLTTLHRYHSQTNFILAKELFSFFSDITEYNRGRLPKDTALSIWSLVMDFFPYFESLDKVEKTTELLDLCCNIGYFITLDTAIYSGDFTTVMYGLLLLKYAYLKSKENGSQTGIDRVNDKYNELERQLAAPHDKNYLELIGYFRKDLSEKGLQFPMISNNLSRLIYPERG